MCAKTQLMRYFNMLKFCLHVHSCSTTKSPRLSKTLSPPSDCGCGKANMNSGKSTRFTKMIWLIICIFLSLQRSCTVGNAWIYLASWRGNFLFKPVLLFWGFFNSNWTKDFSANGCWSHKFRCSGEHSCGCISKPHL